MSKKVTLDYIEFGLLHSIFIDDIGDSWYGSYIEKDSPLLTLEKYNKMVKNKIIVCRSGILKPEIFDGYHRIAGLIKSGINDPTTPISVITIADFDFGHKMFNLWRKGRRKQAIRLITKELGEK